MTIQRKLRYAVSVAALAISTTVFLAESALAQINVITVTAERREESLQTVPISVSAFDRQSLETRQIFQPADLERYTPSLKMRNNITSPTNLSPALRGSLQQDASLAVAESPFGIYVDGLYMARLNGNNIELADLERVEVLRGPQGTLYGRNTLAGAIKFITRTPSPDNEWINGEVGYGSHGRYRVGASIGQNINESFSASISGQATGYNGYVTNLANGDRLGQEENYAGRFKLHYHGCACIDAVASVSYSDSENNGLPLIPATTPTVPAGTMVPPLFLPARQFEFDDLVPTFGERNLFRPAGDRSPVLENEPRGDTEQLIASLDVTYDIGWDASIRSITGYVDTQDVIITDFSGVGAIMFDTDLDTRQISQELQLLGTLFEERLNYIAGFYFFDDKATQSFNWFFFGPVSESTFDSKTRSYSGFAQLDFAVTDNLTVTGGARYTRDRKQIDLNWNIVGLPGIVPIVQDITFTNWTPKFGIDYNVANSFDFVDSLLLYASAAKGFKSGGWSAICIFGCDDARTPYGPETNWTYEGGFKADMFDNRFRANVNYFYNDITDLTLNATVCLSACNTTMPVLSFPVANAGDAVIRGAEIEMIVSPLEGLNIFAVAEVSNAKFTRLNPTTAPANALADFGVANAIPPAVPHWALTLGFDYSHDLTIGGLDSILSFGVDWYHSDDYVSAASNETVVSPFDRINAFAAVELEEHWKLSFSMENVNNDYEIQTGSRGLGGFYEWPPRNYLFKLSYSG